MLIESIHIKNFRCIFDEELHCEELTALVGTNGSGKSTFLRGLELFYTPSPKIEPEDFYNEDITLEIVVGVTFKDLSPSAETLFSHYVKNNRLTVERVFVWESGKTSWKYHGAIPQNPAFQPIRDGLQIKDRGKTAKEAYESIKTDEDYNSLPAWSTLKDAEDNLRAWEAEHLDKCTRQRDDGQFFGFKEVAQGYLGKFTRFLFIPAVRDASEDCSEGRGSVLTELMDLVVRSALATNEELKELKREVQERYTQIIDPTNQTELTTLADGMTKTLKTFVPDSDVKVDLHWLPLTEIDFSLPQADIRLIEDGYSSAIVRTGHGLQRAFILTILQHLALAQTTVNDDEHQNQPDLPDLVLAIEEPELYQHPSRQRHLARIFLQLASGTIPGVADETQIVYATHSPLFVGIDRIDQVRLFRKIPNEADKPKITKIISTNLDRIAEIVWKADGEPGEQFNRDTLLPRLQAIMTPWMNEGFFADVTVLVEGEDDRAAILGVGRAMEHELESEGIAIIPCGGKTSLDRPAAMFKELGIPVYLIWDSDNGDNNARPEENHRLLRLMNQPVVDWPSQVHDHFACFEVKLEATLHAEIGEADFEQWLQQCQTEFCIPKRKHAIKNPVVVATILQKAQQNGLKSHTLEAIVEKILALKN